MLGIGTSEALMIAIVVLLWIGPERMPELVRRIRDWWDSGGS